MRILNITIRGETYMVDENGCIFGGPNKIKEPSGNWKFLGVSTHHWHRRIIHTFEDIWKNPKLAINGYLWDLDHGTTRTWMGQYHGKIPRITSAYITGELHA